MKRSGPPKRRTPLERGAPLTADREKRQAFERRGRENSTFGKKRRAVSPASTVQRIKVREEVCVVCGADGCHPAHLWDRSKGGCDDSLCVVPLCPTCHRRYDDEVFDLTPFLIQAGRVPEMQHALGHARSPLLLLERLTNQRHQPTRRSA